MPRKKKTTKPKTKDNETKIEVVYALRHIESGRILWMSRTLNTGGHACNEYTVELNHYGCDDDYDINFWYIDELVNAEFVRNFSTEWYNSSERTPNHSYEPEELEVVEITRQITTKKVNPHIPSVKEFYRLKYEKDNIGHYNCIMKEIERPYSNLSYMLYDLLQLIADGKWKPEEGKSNDNRSNKSSGSTKK